MAEGFYSGMTRIVVEGLTEDRPTGQKVFILG